MKTQKSIAEKHHGCEPSILVRGRFSPRYKVQLHMLDNEGRTEQSHKDECNINNIMKRYINTGVIDHINQHEGNYGIALDTDLHESMNLIKQAEEIFLDLPSQIRKQFNNDPAAFFDFAENPENISKLEEMGLAESRSNEQKTKINTNTPKTQKNTTQETHETDKNTPTPKSN